MSSFGSEYWSFLVLELTRSRWRPFFFIWRSPVFGRKKPLNFWFRPGKAFEFRRRPFFYWDHLFLAGKTPWISDFGVWISVKTFFFFRRSPNFHWKIASIQFKTNESLGQVRFRLDQTSKKAPPPSLCEILATRLASSPRKLACSRLEDSTIFGVV